MNAVFSCGPIKKGDAVASFPPQLNKGVIVKITAIHIFRVCALFAALALTACGGGSDEPQARTLCSAQNLSACGGGGGLSGGGTTTTQSTMTLSLLDQSGNPANLLTGAGSLSAKARVTNAAGQPVSGAVVQFTIGDATLATINPASGLTDKDGIALVTITLASPSAVGATTINASASFDDAANPGTKISVSGSANFKVGAAIQDTPASIVLVSISPADKSILLQGTIGTGRVQTAQVVFKVTGKNGQAIANQKVKFAFVPASADLTFASDNGVSGLNGEVTAIVNSGNTVTVAAVRVSVVDQSNNPVLDQNGLPISAVSDQITVTNTTLNPNGITISQDLFSIEGLNVAGKSAKITVWLSDLQGAAITDGTAVTFTTNGGAIVGDNNSAKCTTKNGSCSVSLSGQNPQPPLGIADVIASVQLNGSIVTRHVFVAMSGSFAVFSGGFSLNFTGPPASCDPQTITFNLADVNGNIMPEGSKLSIRAPLNASGVLVNDTVKYQGSLTGGTTHALQVTPGGAIACNAAGTRTVTGSMTLVLTTPYGIETTQAVTVQYRAM
ncbi:Ig-like domain-containing protein [Herminiimonas sp. CN]|uniref:Ig-like domain-containing protein n=1 Tax=Herminiimonas sp. CN TaxID=1349818 RepID=UPI000473C7CC|nr:Ig-like domain-containing protein [Herminiimonas sp. CN]